MRGGGARWRIRRQTSEAVGARYCSGNVTSESRARVTQSCGRHFCRRNKKAQHMAARAASGFTASPSNFDLKVVESPGVRLADTLSIGLLVLGARHRRTAYTFFSYPVHEWNCLSSRLCLCPRFTFALVRRLILYDSLSIFLGKLEWKSSNKSSRSFLTSISKRRL